MAVESLSIPTPTPAELDPGKFFCPRPLPGFDPDKDPDPGRGHTPAKFSDPGPGRDQTTNKNSDPDPGRGPTPVNVYGPDPTQGLPRL